MRRKKLLKKGLAVFAAMLLTVSSCVMVTYAENDTTSESSGGSEDSGKSDGSDSSGSSGKSDSSDSSGGSGKSDSSDSSGGSGKSDSSDSAGGSGKSDSSDSSGGSGKSDSSDSSDSAGSSGKSDSSDSSDSSGGSGKSDSSDSADSADDSGKQDGSDGSGTSGDTNDAADESGTSAGTDKGEDGGTADDGENSASDSAEEGEDVGTADDGENSASGSTEGEDGLSEETEAGQEDGLTEDTENAGEEPDAAQAEEDEAVASLESEDVPVDNVSNYQGVYIDSDFSDWDGVSKTEVNNDYIKESAMVYEGDYVYLYLHTGDPHAADLDGLSYDLLTDLGQHNKFKLVYDQEQGIYTITGIDGAEIQSSDLTWGNEDGYYYEISIPVASLERVNESLAFGIYLDDTFNELVTGVGMTETGNGTVVTEPDYSAISFDDGSYSDWEYVPKTTIQYSTDYSHATVADGYSAIYSNGDVAYGYVETVMPEHLNVHDVTKAVTISVNRDSALDDTDAGDMAIQFKYIAVDQNGKMTTVNTEDLPNGTYTYYLVDIGAGIGGYATFQDFLEYGSQWGDYCYGEARLTVNDSIGQMEYVVDMKNLAAKFGLESANIMTVSAQYGRIGQQWTTCAGTSTGPVWGLLLCGGVVAAVYLQRRKNGRLDGCFA